MTGAPKDAGRSGLRKAVRHRRGDWRAGRPGGHFPSSVFLADTGGLASASGSLRCSPGDSLVAFLFGPVYVSVLPSRPGSCWLFSHRRPEQGDTG